MKKFDEMRASEVKAGRFYVKETLRMVYRIIQEEGNLVYWQGYDLATRRPVGEIFVCSKQQVFRWVDREATPKNLETATPDNRQVKLTFRDKHKNCTFAALIARSATDDGVATAGYRPTQPIIG